MDSIRTLRYLRIWVVHKTEQYMKKPRSTIVEQIDTVEVFLRVIRCSHTNQHKLDHLLMNMPSYPQYVANYLDNG